MSRINFTEEHAKNILQGIAYRICDHCMVDPLKCGSRYGNQNRCDKLAREVDKMFEEYH